MITADSVLALTDQSSDLTVYRQYLTVMTVITVKFDSKKFELQI